MRRERVSRPPRRRISPPCLAAALRVAAIALGLGITLGGAFACEAGAPGWRDDAGHCVTWRQLDDRCGIPPSRHCTPDNPDPASETLFATPKGDPSAPPCRGCGCKGGPGYRGPNGRCVGWKELARVCGAVLPGACKAEQVDSRAETIEAQENFIASKPKRR